MKANLNGKEVELNSVEVLSSTETWSEYTLSDGSILKVKPIITNVYKVKDAVNIDGKPMYQVQSQIIVAVK